MCRNSHGEIPNITGHIYASIGFWLTDGAIWTGGINQGDYSHAYRDDNTGWYLYLDASHCSNNYGNYKEVRPKYNCVKFYMKF